MRVSRQLKRKVERVLESAVRDTHLSSLPSLQQAVGSQKAAVEVFQELKQYVLRAEDVSWLLARVQPLAGAAAAAARRDVDPSPAQLPPVRAVVGTAMFLLYHSLDMSVGLPVEEEPCLRTMAGAAALALDVGPRLLREPEAPARSVQAAMAGSAAGLGSGPAWGLTPVLTASTTVLSLLAYPAHQC